MARIIGQDDNAYMVETDAGAIVPIAKTGITEDLAAAIDPNNQFLPPERGLFDRAPGEGFVDTEFAKRFANRQPGQGVMDAIRSPVETNQPNPTATPEEVGQLPSYLQRPEEPAPDPIDLTRPGRPAGSAYDRPQGRTKIGIEGSVMSPNQTPSAPSGGLPGFDLMRRGQDRLSDVREEAANETYQALQGQEEAMAAFDLQRQKEREAFQEQYNEQFNKSEEAVQAFKEADIKNPWATRSTGQKITAALSIALGGFVQGMQGGENMALNIINDAIERDLQIQQANLSKLGTQAQLERNLLGDLRNKGMDERQAYLTARQIMLQSAQRELDTIAAQYKAPEIQATRDVLNGQLMNQEMETKAALSQTLANTLKTQMDTAKLQMESERPKPTKAQEMVDKEFAKTYQDFFLSGKFADAQKNLDQLKMVQSQLASGASLTGPIQGLAPDFIRRFTNPDAIEARAAVEEVVQRNLREVLGAQFTEKEGERLISRAFDEKVDEEENLRRVTRLVNQMERALQAKQDAARYFVQNGTMLNYDGTLPSQIQTADQFENANFLVDEERDQKVLNWARMNPQDPVAMEILKSAGER